MEETLLCQVLYLPIHWEDHPCPSLSLLIQSTQVAKRKSFFFMPLHFPRFLSPVHHFLWFWESSQVLCLLQVTFFPQVHWNFSLLVLHQLLVKLSVQQLRGWINKQTSKGKLWLDWDNLLGVSCLSPTPWCPHAPLPQVFPTPTLVL